MFKNQHYKHLYSFKLRPLLEAKNDSKSSHLPYLQFSYSINASASIFKTKSIRPLFADFQAFKPIRTNAPLTDILYPKQGHMKTKSTFNSLLLVGALVFALMLSSCSHSYQAELNSGDNEYVFYKALKKLQRKPKNEKAALALEKAYNRLESSDLREIKFAKGEGDPANNVKIFDLYKRLARRQDQISPILPHFMKKEGRFIDVELSDYDTEIIAAKKTAALYLYTKGSQLLETGSRADARAANNLFERVIDFYPTFRDVREKALLAKASSKSDVLLTVSNGSGQHIPAHLFADIERIGLKNTEWANVFSNNSSQNDFDYRVNFVVEDLFVGPEALREHSYRAEREIITQQNLVIHNKIQLDSLGKPIMIDVPLVIFCDVLEINQQKEGWVSGRIEVMDAKSNRLLMEKNIKGRSIFDNRYAIANGNLDALNKDTHRLLNNRAMPFPPDKTILQSSVNDIKPEVSSIIKDYKHLFL